MKKKRLKNVNEYSLENLSPPSFIVRFSLLALLTGIADRLFNVFPKSMIFEDENVVQDRAHSQKLNQPPVFHWCECVPCTVQHSQPCRCNFNLCSSKASRRNIYKGLKPEQTKRPTPTFLYSHLGARQVTPGLIISSRHKEEISSRNTRPAVRDHNVNTARFEVSTNRRLFICRSH